MVYWAAIFFVVALAFAIAGFGLPIVAGLASIAPMVKILFFVFLTLGTLLLIFNRGK